MLHQHIVPTYLTTPQPHNNPLSSSNSTISLCSNHENTSYISQFSPLQPSYTNNTDNTSNNEYNHSIHHQSSNQLNPSMTLNSSMFQLPPSQPYQNKNNIQLSPIESRLNQLESTLLKTQIRLQLTEDYINTHINTNNAAATEHNNNQYDLLWKRIDELTIQYTSLMDTYDTNHTQQLQQYSTIQKSIQNIVSMNDMYQNSVTNVCERLNNKYEQMNKSVNDYMASNNHNITIIQNDTQTLTNTFEQCNNDLLNELSTTKLELYNHIESIHNESIQQHKTTTDELNQRCVALQNVCTEQAAVWMEQLQHTNNITHNYNIELQHHSKKQYDMNVQIEFITNELQQIKQQYNQLSRQHTTNNNNNCSTDNTADELCVLQLPVLQTNSELIHSLQQEMNALLNNTR